jgi:hypothetical protein
VVAWAGFLLVPFTAAQQSAKGVMSLVLSDERGNESGFGDVLSEVENHPRVVEALSAMPVSKRRNGNSSRIPAKQAIVNDATALTVYRDPEDVRTIFNLTRLLMLLAVIIVASGAANIFQYLRRPDRIVVDGSSGRVLSINDRNYGKEENVEFGPDRLTTEDKLYATKEFVRYLYRVDPATRPRDIEKALRMMVPDSAVKFSTWLREKGILDLQKAESWQAVWTPMDVSVDQSDPYKVNVIGKQEISKVVGGAAQNENKQLRLTVKLVADPKGRADRNLRTGFLIAVLDAHDLPDGSSPSLPKRSAENRSDNGEQRQ